MKAPRMFDVGHNNQLLQSSAFITRLIYHDTTYDTAIIVAESESDIRITTPPHTSPSRASYGVSIVRILEKIDRVITAPHWF